MDKDIIEVIAEMLIKQDETNQRLVETNQRLEQTNQKIEQTNNILKDFMEISIKQWNEQHRFNEKLFEKLTDLVKFEDRIKHLEALETRVEKIEKILKAP